MTQGLPDEYFRKRTAESDDVVDEAKPASRHRGSTAVKTVAPRNVHDGVSLRAFASVLVLALLTAFVVGRVFVYAPDVAAPVSTAASTSPAPRATDTAAAFAPYDGPVTVINAMSAAGTCLDGGSRDAPAALVDDSLDTLWRCQGEGVGETVRFEFSAPVTLVGLRVVNGNTVWTDRYLAERRITSIRWEFADGSYFAQGLAANDRSPQEVRFPPIDTTGVTMTIADVTAPGDGGPTANAVSISSMEFLVPA